MSVLAAPLAAAALLLVVAGAGKVRRPGSGVLALRSIGWRVPSAVVRTAGAAELLLGIATLALGGPVPAALVAVSYAAFSGFVALALRRGGALGSCGCFGVPDTPPTATHAVLTAALAAVAVAAVARPVPPAAGGPLLLGFAALLGWLGYLVLAVLPSASGRAVRSIRR